VGQQGDEHLLGRVVVIVGDVPVHADADGGQDEHDVDEVQVALAVPDGDLEAAPHGRPAHRVALVQVGLLRAGRGEDGDLASEPPGQEEGTDDRH
jgi:hypothetical protein